MAKLVTALSVNLNKIALLRNSRGSDYPSVIDFASRAVEAGANGLTIHPRPDQRHIRVDDVYALGNYAAGLTNIEFNIEGNPFAPPLASAKHSDYPGLLKLIEQTRPDQATLVPDNDDQLTSDHGFDLTQEGENIKLVVDQLKHWGVRSSLFMDPDIEQITLAKQVGADRIELYTGPYALACQHSPEAAAASLATYRAAADHAHHIGLGVNAGHDLNLENLGAFLSIGNIAEVSIGHALTVDGLILGYKVAILDYIRLCNNLE
ncbi:MAG: pyridoxine 5'-phosphate synthase [Pseudomonadota bacterium]